MADELDLKASDTEGSYILTTATETEYSEEWIDNQISVLTANIESYQAQLVKYQAIKDKISEIKGA